MLSKDEIQFRANKTNILQDVLSRKIIIYDWICLISHRFFCLCRLICSARVNNFITIKILLQKELRSLCLKKKDINSWRVNIEVKVPLKTLGASQETPYHHCYVSLVISNLKWLEEHWISELTDHKYQEWVRIPEQHIRKASLPPLAFRTSRNN